MKDQIKEKLDYLKNSIIYAMSLSAKELFHSNVWAWIIRQDKYRSFINCFFEDFEIEKFDRICREEKNRDLVIHDKDGNEYVIENKFKSIPKKQQLKDYEKGNFKYGCICAIKKPLFELSNWKYTSYSEISKKLKELVTSDDSFEAKIIEEYSTILEYIEIVLNYYLDDENYKNKLEFENAKPLEINEIRLSDIYKKLKAESFIEFFNNNVNEYKNENNYGTATFYISNNFNHSNATIDFYFSDYSKEKEETKKIGIQIENNQFRLFIYNKNLNLNEIFEKGKINNWFNDYNDKKIRNNKNEMRNSYCKYGNNFVYQYFTIDEEMKDFETLIKIIVRELILAEKLFNII